MWVCVCVCTPPNYLKKVVYLSYLCKLISVCHQRLFISSFPKTWPYGRTGSLNCSSHVTVWQCPSICKIKNYTVAWWSVEYDLSACVCAFIDKRNKYIHNRIIKSLISRYNSAFVWVISTFLHVTMSFTMLLWPYVKEVNHYMTKLCNGGQGTMSIEHGGTYDQGMMRQQLR